MFLGRKDPDQGTSHCGPGALRVGGQAVIEGVMMRAPKSMAIAVRRPSGEIVVKRKGLNLFSEKHRLSKFPLVRGVMTLLSALVLGIQALNYSANEALSEGKEETNPWTLSLTLVIALSLGIVLFFLVPLYLTKWSRGVIPLVSESGLFFNLVDGILRLMIFLAYLWLISLSKEIRRVFQYHGAEHKSIFAFEAGEALRVDRVKSYSHLHPRCGTSFLLIVMVVSILVFALIPHHLPFGYKVASRVIFIPLIAGISYEFIRFADRRRQHPAMRFFILPGLWLQRLTSREPSEDQLEVAIRALQEVLELEGQSEALRASR